MTREETFHRALFVWGWEAQMDMVCEECAELIAAVCQARRGRATVADLASEVADVEIMCGQMRAMIGADHVDAAVEAKMERLRDRLSNCPDGPR
jgi:hypothetical protein